MIELQNVSFSYRTGEADAVPALRDLNLRVEPGQFVALIGHHRPTPQPIPDGSRRHPDSML